MAAAEVGDDVLGDDPTVIRLQEYAAGLLGKEAGLDFPSRHHVQPGRAARALTQRGDEVFLHAQAHIIFYEQGAATLSGVQLRCFDSPDGTLDLEKMEASCTRTRTCISRPPASCASRTPTRTAAACILPFEHLRAVRASATGTTCKLHLDGARLWPTPWPPAASRSPSTRPAATR